MLAKYRRWVLNSFVEGQRDIRWCPRPGCEYAALNPAGGARTVVCKCGHQWCFGCGEEAHSPCPCDLVKKWLERDKSDEATQLWLAARTKECPKCHVRIEKNKACNHMTCAKCGHHFCWHCKGPWSSHGSSTGGFYSCQKYNEDVAKGNYSEEEKKLISSTKLLQKYQYYYTRWKDARAGIEFTRKLGKALEAKFANQDINKWGFLLEAVDRLAAARHVLQWTYCLAFYMRQSSTKTLFEYQQGLLLESTEALQDIMDNKSAETLIDLRKDIINRTSSIEKFRQEMVRQVERGDFEECLMSREDDALDADWGCTTCGKINKSTAQQCVSCTACRLHGEMDCKACQNTRKLMAAAAAPGSAGRARS